MDVRSNTGILLALVSAACYGTEAILTKIAYAGGADSLTLLAFRFLFAIIIVWPYFIFSKQRWQIRIIDALRLLLLGAVGLTVVTMAMFAALKYISASLTVMLFYTYPMIITILAAFVLHERITRQKLLALPLALLGCVMLVWSAGAVFNPWGIFYGLLAAGLNAVYVVISARIMRTVPAPIAIAYLMTGAAVVSTVIAGTNGLLIVHFAWKVWLAIGLMVIIATVASNYTFFMAIDRIGASRTAIISTVEPLVTALLAFLFLDERITVLQGLGGLLILTGVFIERGATGKFNVTRNYRKIRGNGNG